MFAAGIGSWKSLSEMEEHITLEELHLLVDASHRKEYRANKFAAALKGVDLDEGQEQADFEKVKMKAQADLAGMNEDEYVFDMIGIEIDTDDD